MDGRYPLFFGRSRETNLILSNLHASVARIARRCIGIQVERGQGAGALARGARGFCMVHGPWRRRCPQRPFFNVARHYIV